MRKNEVWKRKPDATLGQEDRSQPRVLLNLPVEYHARDPRTRRPGHTCNLSPDGVMVNLPEKLNIGQEISLEIFFALGQEMDAVRVNSRVVWVEDVQKDGSYRSGVRFVDLSAADRSKLAKFFEK